MMKTLRNMKVSIPRLAWINVDTGNILIIENTLNKLIGLVFSMLNAVYDMVAKMKHNVLRPSRASSSRSSQGLALDATKYS